MVDDVSWQRIVSRNVLLVRAGVRHLQRWKCSRYSERRCPITESDFSACGRLHVHWDLPALCIPEKRHTVNAVCPGPVNTAMWDQFATRAGGSDPDGDQRARQARAAQIPMGRFAEPEEVAATITFLTDPANRYLTGLSLDVAGGARLGMGS